MNYFLDTEFNEQGGERPTIELISIGLVDELGNEYYAESNAFNEDNCSSWVQMGCPNIKPLNSANEHDALADAKWNQELYEHLIEEQDKRLGRHL